MRKKEKFGESAGLRRNRKKMSVRKTELGRLFFFPASFPRHFLCSILLLPLLAASSAPSTSASRGNGRFLGWRSKRRNCLRVQSSKNASSIWRGRVRWARRPLPCRPAAAAAAAAPASCRGDLEPRPAGVSSRARTRTRTLTLTHTDRHTRRRSRTRPHAPSLPGRQLFGLGLLCCSPAAPLSFCVSSGVTVRVVCPCGAVPCASLRVHHAGPRPWLFLPGSQLHQR